MANKRDLTDELVLDVNFFKEDIETFDEESEKIEKLYNEIDGNIKEFNGNKNFIGRGVLPYVQEQTKNLVTLRSTKASVLNMKLNAKIKISDLALKKKRNNDEGNTMDAMEVAKAALKIIQNNPNRTTAKDIHDHTLNTCEDFDDALSRRYNDLTNEGKIKLTDNEQAIKYEKRNVQIQIVESKTGLQFVAVDGISNTIIKEYPSTLFPSNKKLEKAEKQGDYYLCGSNRYKIYK